MTYATTSYTIFLLDNTIYWLLIANVLFWNYNETYTHELHGNYNQSRLHMAKLIKTTLQDLDWKILPEPPCSPDFSLTIYHFSDHWQIINS